MTQKDRILAALRLGKRCSMEFLDWEPRITRAAARVEELRRDGHEIATTTCRMHWEGVAAHAAYELETGDQMELGL
jgi:hypothetical protein